jgi:putative endonuclease
MKFYVYILTNKYNRVLYTGVTDNIARRIIEHETKKYDGFTKRYNANKLVYYEEHLFDEDARAREKQIKGWIRKKKIDLINSINPDWVDLMYKVNQIEVI